MLLADSSWLNWFYSVWNGTVIGIALGVLGIGATLLTVFWVDYKSRLRTDIDVVLRRCRESGTWDDKSELKLIQWLLDTPEDDLHNCGLLRLRRIRNSLRDYLYIHLYGRDPVPPAAWLESTLQGWADRLRYRRENRVQQKPRARKKNRQRARK